MSVKTTTVVIDLFFTITSREAFNFQESVVVTDKNLKNIGNEGILSNSR